MNIMYFNGKYVNKFMHCVNVEDRGYMLADGVYEVVAIVDGSSIDFDLHASRMIYSMNEIAIDYDYDKLRKKLKIILDELLIRNYAENAAFYMQITRGVAAREHTFPDKISAPTLLAMLNKFDPPKFPMNPIECISTSDIRWSRRDIKSISLLPNVLLKQKAKQASAAEVWLYDTNSVVTECASRNCFIIDNNGNIRTHPENTNILSGVTRNVLVKLARDNGYNVLEKPFTIYEAYDAREAFTTSSITFILPVIKLDGKNIADGKPGTITRELELIYQKHVKKCIENEKIAKSHIV